VLRVHRRLLLLVLLLALQLELRPGLRLVVEYPSIPSVFLLLALQAEARLLLQRFLLQALELVY
jgi:hypothetical protein